MSAKKYAWFCTILILFLFQYANGYRKYYVEDECMPSIKKQKIILRLPATGPDSVGEIRSNRFGTYSRTERNCLLKLSPPTGYGVVLSVLKIDFRNYENCKDFIKILTNDDEEEKLCGYQELGIANQTYFSDDDIRIVYHTSAGGMGFNNGIRLIFTVSKLDDSCSTTSEFRCRNSHCIWAGVMCDGINNCGDASDENFSDYPYCPEITPLAITAVILGIISFIAIVVAMCVCCCRSRPEKPDKPYLFREIPAVPNGGYLPIRGYSYGSTGNTLGHMQPLYSSAVQPSAPTQYSHGYYHSNLPFAQQKVEIRYERPPPYDA